MQVTRDGETSKGVRISLSKEQLSALQNKASAEISKPLFGANVKLEPLGNTKPAASSLKATHATGTSDEHRQHREAAANTSKIASTEEQNVVTPDSWDDDDCDDDWQNVTKIKLNGKPVVSLHENTVDNEIVSADPDPQQENWTDSSPNDLILILNATRYIEEVLGAGRSPERKMLAGSDLLQKLKSGLEESLSNPDELATVEARLESLFEHKLAFQSTRAKLKKAMEVLTSSRREEEEVFVELEYPQMVMNQHQEIVHVSRVWNELREKHAMNEERSDSPSVDMLKRWILDCSRCLTWKMDILHEIDLLAKRESLSLQHRDEVRDRIADLKDLRATLSDLINSSGPGGHQLDESTLDSVYEQLEVVEQDLEAARQELREAGLDEKSKLELSDDVGLVTKASQAQAEEMSVVDMIAAMVLPRCDIWRHNFQTDTEYTEMVVEFHETLQREWKKDFGRLPPPEVLSSSPAEVQDIESDDLSVNEQDFASESASVADFPVTVPPAKKPLPSRGTHLRPGYLGPQRRRSTNPHVVHKVPAKEPLKPTFSHKLQISQQSAKQNQTSSSKAFGLSGGEMDQLLAFINSDEQEREAERASQGKKPAERLQARKEYSAPDPQRMAAALDFVKKNVNSAQARTVVEELNQEEQEEEAEARLILASSRRVLGGDEFDSLTEDEFETSDDERQDKKVVLVRPKQYGNSLITKPKNGPYTKEAEKLQQNNMEVVKLQDGAVDNVSPHVALKVGETEKQKEIEQLIEERELARKSKDYEKADEIRSKLWRLGVIVEDRANKPATLVLRKDSRLEEIPGSPKPSVRKERNRAKKAKKAAKKNRAPEFAKLVVEIFGKKLLEKGSGIVDVAGGKGNLTYEFCREHSLPSTVIDPSCSTLSEFKSKLLVSGASKSTFWGVKEWEDSPSIHSTSAGNADGWLHPKVIQRLTAAEVESCQSYMRELGMRQIRSLFDASVRDNATWHQLLENASIFVGLHPDEATEPIVEMAVQYRKPFAIVPCCIFPHQNPHRSHITKLEDFVDYLSQRAQSLGGFKTSIHHLCNTGGSNIVLIGKP